MGRKTKRLRRTAQLLVVHKYDVGLLLLLQQEYNW